MAEYCSRTNVQNRLTEAGVLAVADRNRSGANTEAELAASVDTAITFAGGRIDAAICEQCEPATARAQTAAGLCPYLRDLAVDLAAARAATHGGQTCPESLKEAADKAQAILDDIQANRRVIPGLTYSPPSNGAGTVGATVVNVW